MDGEVEEGLYVWEHVYGDESIRRARHVLIAAIHGAGRGDLVPGWRIPRRDRSPGPDLRASRRGNKTQHPRIIHPHIARQQNRDRRPPLHRRDRHRRPGHHKRRPSLCLQQPLPLLRSAIEILRTLPPKPRRLLLLDLLLLGPLQTDPRVKDAQHLPCGRVPREFRFDFREAEYTPRTLFLRQRAVAH